MNKQKRTALLLTVLFSVFLALGLLLFLILPKASFSQEEKRVLEKKPAFSLSAVLDGTFEKNMEQYLSDHFPLRKQFVGLNAYYTLMTGRNGLSGVYRGKDGYLLPSPVSAGKTLDSNIAAFEAYFRQCPVPASLMVVPSAGYIMQNKLPLNHPLYQDGDILSAIEEGIPSMQWVELASPFLENRYRQQLYYKTDHHWTSRGAYLAYRAYAGGEATPEERFSVQTFSPFYGTSYAKSGLWATQPDAMELWQPPGDFAVEITDDNRQEPITGGLFFWDQLDGSDPYSVYLDGNHSMVRIVNQEAAGGKLLVIKDSFAHCLAPFLASQYREVTLVDLRYLKSKTVTQLISQLEIDQVLAVYGIDEMANGQDLTFIQ